ncbi:CDP-glucose 4,6-dehydratase [Thiomicrospira sp. S5]|uniref:CDP-glucose 4,6-dehydratase n=1 Tax=Thiomicrospira sp. S5 TaxID=1803865 RepID=UPI000F89FE1B|nr:CDP-glucose 4,6-dehydratase [Thiomicrospira sp. S5]AZR81687.1 CDP-glucose 4,6-dehydratase [Thiomicrospira sp. S5]
MIDVSFWQGKRVYLTGHTGFKGSWLSLWLADMGAIVKGYALNPPTNPSLYEEANVSEKIESQIGDIRDFETLKTSMMEFNPDILIHMAAQPLVRLSYKEPLETYDTNVMGTAKVLETARSCSNLKSIVSVTTDKCYENREWVWGYREDEPMGGYDPYSSSKGCAELVTSAYRRSFMQEQGIGLASARAGNVIGGGDWADDRLVPDILRAFEKTQPVVIRNPASTRPWQHVLEPLSGYLVLAQHLYQTPTDFAEGWNFGPYEDDAKPVDWILNHMVANWPGASWELDKNAHPHEAGYLKLDVSKAKARLKWHPTWRLEQTLAKIIKWHQAWLNKADIQQVCLEEINEFMRDFNNANY